MNKNNIDIMLLVETHLTSKYNFRNKRLHFLPNRSSRW